MSEMKDFEEIKFIYYACIKNISSGTNYQSKNSFDTYEKAWSYLRDNIPDGFEGYVIQLPKVEFNLEFDSYAKQQNKKSNKY